MTSRVRLLSHISLIAIILWLGLTANAQTRDEKAKPTGSISGHILVDNKAGAGIEVGALGGDSGLNRRIAAAQTRTDSEGYYHLTGLPAGNYQITTYISNLTSAEPITENFGFVYFNSSKSVLLAAGEEVNDLDIKLVRGGVITGRITDADNKPVVEERVSLQPVADPSNPRGVRLMAPITPMYITDDRGVYRLYGLPAGRYRVSVGQSAQGGLSSPNGFYPLTYHPDVSDPGRATIIDLTEGGEAANVDIRVGRREDTYTITGRVVDSEGGLPIAGARIGVVFVRADRPEQGYATGSIGNTTTADGKFTVQGITTGRYGIYVLSENDESDFYSDPVYFEVTDKDVSGVEIKAVRGLNISGTVVAESGDLKELLKQLPTLRISASVFPPGGRVTTTTLRSFGSGKVGADGSFVISGLRPGRAMISVTSSDSAKRASISKVSVGGVGVTQGFEIEGQSVSGVQVLLAYGAGVIRGTLTFQGGTLPNFRSEVICRRDGGGSFTGGATLDARGHFVITGLPQGTYDCGLQFIRLPGVPPGVPPERPPQAQHQSITVTNTAEASLNFVVDLTPKGVGP